MPVDLKSAIIRLHEDIALTDELTDIPAKVLLKWGEAQLYKIANRTDDEAAFEEQFKSLRWLMKSINRFTGRRHEMDDEKQLNYVRKIIEGAADMGYTAAYGQVGAFVQQQKDYNEMENINAMIALLETGTPNVPLI